MSQVKCPHCGFMNFALSAYCGRCDRPIKDSTHSTLNVPLPVPPQPLLRRPPATGTTEPTARLPESVRSSPLPPHESDKTSISPPPQAVQELATLQRARPSPSAPPRASSSTGPSPVLGRSAATGEKPLGTSPMPAAFSRLGQQKMRGPEGLPNFSPRRDLGQNDSTVVRNVEVPLEARTPHDRPTRVAQSRPRELQSEDEGYATLLPEGRPTSRTTTTSAAADVEPTRIPAARPPWFRLLFAASIDTALCLLTALAMMGAEMLMFGERWPADKTSLLDGLADWLNLYPGTSRHALWATGLFSWIYSAVGSRFGQTAGRSLVGLVALTRHGNRLGWFTAVVRGAGSLASLLLFGAGYFWVVVDTQRRTWHDILTRSIVVVRR